DAALEALRTHKERAEHSFEQFAKENLGVFTGPISRETQETLLAGEYFGEHQSELDNMDLLGKLRAWREDEERLWDADVSSLPDEARRALKDGLANALREYVVAWEELQRVAEDMKDALRREGLDRIDD